MPNGNNELRQLLRSRFEIAIDPIHHEEVVDPLVDFIVDVLLNLDAPSCSSDESQSIVIFAFGWIRLLNGNLEPGPINDDLLEVTRQILSRNAHASVHAQHEVGERLAADGERQINVIYPTIDEMTTVDYLSTAGVWTKVIDYAGGPERLGKTLVLGHRFHVPRVCRQGRNLGVDCYIPNDVSLPAAFDPSLQNQPWCRNALVFLVHSMISELVFFRRAVLRAAAPSTRDD